MVLTVGNVVYIGVGISVRLCSVGVKQLGIRFSISFSLTLVEAFGFGSNKGQDRDKNL